MKQGNQLFLECEIYDKNGDKLNISSVSKVQFNIDTLTKTYDSSLQTQTEVEYDALNKVFKIWLTEEETFAFDNKTQIDARILFNNDTIMGTYIEQKYVYDSLKQEKLIEEEVEND